MSLNTKPQNEADAWRAIRQYAGAQPAFDKLCEEGCDRERLKGYLIIVWRELKPTEYRVRPEERDRKFHRLIRKLRELSNIDKVWEMIPYEAFAAEAFDQLLSFPDFFSPLAAAASMLEKAPRVRRARKPQYPSILALLGEVKRGTRTHNYHYAEVENLVNAASCAAGSKKQFDATTLTNMIHRQKKKRVAQT